MLKSFCSNINLAKYKACAVYKSPLIPHFYSLYWLYSECLSRKCPTVTTYIMAKNVGLKFVS